MIISRRQQTAESSSRDRAEKSGIWGEGWMGRLAGASLKRKNQDLPLQSDSLSVMEFG